MTIYEAIRNDHMKVTRLLDELVRLNEGDEVREEGFINSETQVLSSIKSHDTKKGRFL
ncbi:MAG: hypothetical protein ACK5Y2_09215 [Bdellovibrionales bacterium]